MTSAATRLSVAGTAPGPASASAGIIPPPTRGRRSPVEWLVAPAPAARLAMLRILVGVYATAWAVVRLPAHLAHTDQVAVRWQPVGVLAPLESPPADPAILLLAVTAPLLGVLFVAGWRYRAIGPLFAVAVLLLATLDSSWGQVFHTEHLVVLHLLILAAASAADVLAIGRRRVPPGLAVDGRYGWPVRLMAVVVVLTYMIAGIAKLRIGGLDWLDGDTLRNWVAHDNLRKAVLGDTYSPIGRHLVRHAWLFPPIAVLTVIVELGAWAALLGGRWRTTWVVAAWLFHVGVLALMAILFPYQLTGVTFAAFFRLEQLADRIGHGRPRDDRAPPAECPEQAKDGRPSACLDLPKPWSGGGDLNSRPLRPERVCDPPTRYFAVYSASAGVSWHQFRAAYGGKMAENPGWEADIGKFTTVDRGGTDPTPLPHARHRRLRSPRSAWLASTCGRIAKSPLRWPETASQ
jgi:HTTM domain